MSPPSLGPLAIKKADGANTSNCGGIQSGTEEMKLSINGVICSQLSTWLLGAIVDTAMVVLVLGG